MIVHATENQLEDVAALALKLFPETGSDTIREEMRALLSDGNAAIFLHYTGEGGGCSPIGMKKQFPTFVHQSAAGYPVLMFSAGKIGYQVELPLASLQKAVRLTLCDLIVEK